MAQSFSMGRLAVCLESSPLWPQHGLPPEGPCVVGPQVTQGDLPSLKQLMSNFVLSPGRPAVVPRLSQLLGLGRGHIFQGGKGWCLDHHRRLPLGALG